MLVVTGRHCQSDLATKTDNLRVGTVRSRYSDDGLCDDLVSAIFVSQQAYRCSEILLVVLRKPCRRLILSQDVLPALVVNMHYRYTVSAILHSSLLPLDFESVCL